MDGNINNHIMLVEYNNNIKELLDMDFFPQATITCRTALEYMVSQFVLEYNQSLNLCDTVYEKINGLKENGFISDEWVSTSALLRKIANDGGAHDNSLSGKAITKEVANLCYSYLLELENEFVDKIPFPSKKEIIEGFVNKKYAKDSIIEKLKSSTHFFNISDPHESHGTIWYTFYYRIKLTSDGTQLINPNYTEKCGKDGDYNIYKLNDKKENIIVWINNYYELINKCNSKTVDELNAINQHRIEKKQEQLKNEQAQHAKEERIKELFLQNKDLQKQYKIRNVFGSLHDAIEAIAEGVNEMSPMTRFFIGLILWPVTLLLLGALKVDINNEFFVIALPIIFLFFNRIVIYILCFLLNIFISIILKLVNNRINSIEQKILNE